MRTKVKIGYLYHGVDGIPDFNCRFVKIGNYTDHNMLHCYNIHCTHCGGFCGVMRDSFLGDIICAECGRCTSILDDIKSDEVAALFGRAAPMKVNPRWRWLQCAKVV